MNVPLMIALAALLSAAPWLFRAARGPALVDRMLGAVVALDCVACAAAALLLEAEARALAALLVLPGAGFVLVLLTLKQLRYGSLQPRLAAAPGENTAPRHPNA